MSSIPTAYLPTFTLKCKATWFIISRHPDDFTPFCSLPAVTVRVHDNSTTHYAATEEIRRWTTYWYHLSRFQALIPYMLHQVNSELASYGAYLVRILEKIDRVIKAPHYIWLYFYTFIFIIIRPIANNITLYLCIAINLIMATMDIHLVPQFYNVFIIEYLSQLTHCDRDKLAAISQTTLSDAFSWMKMFEFRLKFRWRLF